MSLYSVFLLAKGKHADKLDRTGMEWAVVGPGEQTDLKCEQCNKQEQTIAYFKHLKEPTTVLCKRCFVRRFEY